MSAAGRTFNEEEIRAKYTANVCPQIQRYNS
jgi:hypothetical protein